MITFAVAASRHRRVPLWEVAWRRGIVYGGSISTWMFQPDPAYARLFRREVAMLWPEDDFLWYRLRPAPTSGLHFKYPDLIVEFAERNGQLVISASGPAQEPPGRWCYPGHRGQGLPPPQGGA